MYVVSSILGSHVLFTNCTRFEIIDDTILAAFGRLIYRFYPMFLVFSSKMGRIISGLMWAKSQRKNDKKEKSLYSKWANVNSVRKPLDDVNLVNSNLKSLTRQLWRHSPSNFLKACAGWFRSWNTANKANENKTLETTTRVKDLYIKPWKMTSVLPPLRNDASVPTMTTCERKKKTFPLCTWGGTQTMVSSYSIDYGQKDGNPSENRPCSATRRNRPHPSEVIIFRLSCPFNHPNLRVWFLFSTRKKAF